MVGTSAAAARPRALVSAGMAGIVGALVLSTLAVLAPGTALLSPAAAADPACAVKAVDEGAPYTVPAGVSRVRIVAYGEAGVDGWSAIGPTPLRAGEGARVTADVPVSAGDVLQDVRLDGGQRGLGGDRREHAVEEYGVNGTRGGPGRGVVRVEGGCRQYLVVAGGGGGNGSDYWVSDRWDDSTYGRGLSARGGAAGLGPDDPARAGEAGERNRNDQEDGAGGAGASLTAGGAGGAGGRDSLSLCANGVRGGDGGFETAGTGANGRDEDDCRARSGGGGGGGGYYGGGGGGSHQDDDSGSGGGGGGSSYVISGATSVAYERHPNQNTPTPTVEPMWIPVGAPTSVSPVGHHQSAAVTFTPTAAPFEVASYTITATPGGRTASVEAGDGALTGTVTGLANATAYRFTVTAVPAEGVLLDGAPAVSPLSNPVTPAPEPPTAVRGLAASPGDGTVRLTWDPPADDRGQPVTGYWITWPGRGQVATSTSATIDLGLVNGRATEFTVVARNSVGDGPSASVTATPRASAKPVQQPKPTALPGNGYVDLRFTPAEPGYDQFVVTTEPATSCGSVFPIVQDYGYGSATVLRVPCLDNGRTYRFTVAARNDQGVGPASDRSDPVSPGLTAPTAVGATVRRAHDALRVDIDYVIDGGSPVTSLSAYAVRWGGHRTETVTVDLETPGELPDHLTIPGVTSAEDHQVFVSVTNAEGTLGFQQVGSGRPYVTPPQPTSVSASVPRTAAGGTVVVAFDTWQRTDCGTYTITASPGGLTRTAAIEGPGGGTECGGLQQHQVEFDGLDDDTSYTFTVQVSVPVAGAGPVSDASAPIRPFASRAPGEVGDLVATPAGDGKVRLSFTPAAPGSWRFPVAVYQVEYDGLAESVPAAQMADGEHVVRGLQNGREHVFSVFAINDVGSGRSVSSAPVTPRRLGTPTDLSAEVADGSVRLSFTGVEDNGGGGLVHVVTLTDPQGLPAGQVVTDSSPVLFTGLDNGRSYVATVVARNDDGSGDPSRDLTVTPRSDRPAPPADVTAVSTRPAEATISWTAPRVAGGADIVGYTVTAQPGGRQVVVERAGPGSPAPTTATMTGLDNGTAYRFTVRADTGACGTPCSGMASDPSNAVTPQLLAQAPLVVLPTSGIYGQRFAISVTGGSGSGAVGSPTASGGACSVHGSQLRLDHATAPGLTCTLSITKAGDGTYAPATAEQVVTIARRPLLVTAASARVTYGDTPSWGVSYGGFATGDGASDLGGALTFGGSAITDPGVGIRELVPGGLTSADYDITFASSQVRFDPRPVRITVLSASKVYGAGLPALGASISNQVPGEFPDFTLTTTATRTSRPGPDYPITATLGSNPNYDVTVVPGVMTVRPAPLVITARDLTAAHGEPVSPRVDADGLVGSDSLDDFDGSLAYDIRPLAAPSAPNTYEIVPSGLTSSSYDITWRSGTLTRTQRDAAVSWPTPDAIRYGEQLTADELDASADAPGTFTYTPALGTVLSAGTHRLSVEFVPDDPDRFRGATRTVDLEVAKAPLTVTAEDSWKVYGRANPRFVVDHRGFVNGDGAADLGGELSFATAAHQFSDAGDYDVTPAGLTSSDYEITFETGTLEVVQAPLLVEVRDASRLFGAANPSFRADYVGLADPADRFLMGGELVFATDADADSPVGDYAVTASGLVSTNYDIAYEPGTLTVVRAPSTVTWDDPEPIGYGTALSATQLDAVAGVPGTLTYTPAPGTVLGAGTHELTVELTPTDAVNRAPVSATVDLVVTKAPLTVTTRDVARAYGAANPAFVVDHEGFVNGDDAGDLGGALVFTTGADADSPVGDYDVTPSGLTSSDYAITHVAGTLSVEKAATSVTWDAPAGIGYGTALSATQLDATADVSGTFSYTPGLGIVLGAGTHELTVEFTPTDARNHRSSSATVDLVVSRAPLTVTTRDAARAYGAANPAFVVDHEGFVNGDDAGDLGGTLRFDTDADRQSPVGDYDVTPSGLTSSDYAITHVAGTLSVEKAPTWLTWDDPAGIGYGTALTAAQLDATADAPGTFTYTPALGTVLHAGIHELTVEFTPTDARNHRSSSATVDLVVSKAPLTVTTRDASRPYGAANPAFVADHEGFVNGDDAGDLGGALVFDTDADADSPVGDYDVTPSGLTSADYAITFEPGTLTVGTAEPTITWSAPDPIEYGTALATSHLDAMADVPGTFTYAPALGTVLHAGVHDLRATFTPDDPDSYAQASEIVRVEVTRAPLTVTAQDASRPFGAGDPAFEVAYDGLVNGDGPGALAGRLVFTTTASPGSPVGRYAVTPGGLTSSDYDITFVAGVLDVTAGSPGLSWATPAPIRYGTALTELQLGATTGIPGRFDYTPALGTVLHAGTHDLRVTFTPADRYLSSLSRTVRLTVTKAPLRVTADSARRVHGVANPELTASYDGFVNGDGPESLRGTPTLRTSATETSGAGTYPIRVSGLSSSDYALTFAAGTLTVTRAEVEITGARVVVPRSGPSRRIALSATVVHAVTDQPVAGARVTFRLDRTGRAAVVCRATTDADGVAACRTPRVRPAALAASPTYRIASEGTGDLRAGRATGELRRR